MAIYLGAGVVLQLAGLSVSVLAFFAFTAAVIVNYVMQRMWVFVDSSPLAESLPKYVLMISVGYFINGLTLMSATPHISLLWAQFVAIILVVVSNATLSFLWVFYKK